MIVGTPVYRASYTGALKHLFDLMHYGPGRHAVLLAATGGTRMHGLVPSTSSVRSWASSGR